MDTRTELKSVLAAGERDKASSLEYLLPPTDAVQRDPLMQVVYKRKGSVLAANTILKYDHYDVVGKATLAGGSIGIIPLAGAPNFRKVRSTGFPSPPIYYPITAISSPSPSQLLLTSSTSPPSSDHDFEG